MDSDGFVKTGDIGYVDQLGFVYVIDRKKDIFKYNGFHINPSEIENVIQTIEGVEFVSVVAIPNDPTCNLAAAAIKKKADCEDFSEQDVIDKVASVLPEYKQLHGGVFFLEDIPCTASGKFLRRATQDLVVKMFKDRHIL